VERIRNALRKLRGPDDTPKNIQHISAVRKKRAGNNGKHGRELRARQPIIQNQISGGAYNYLKKKEGFQIKKRCTKGVFWYIDRAGSEKMQRRVTENTGQKKELGKGLNPHRKENLG